MLTGFTQADQDVSFEGIKKRQEAALRIVEKDPDVEAIGASIGGSASYGFNTGRMFIQLKPVGARRATADEIIQRLRVKLAELPGIDTYLQSVQNIQLGGRLSRTQYQYTLEDTDVDELNLWAPKMLAKLKASPLLQDGALAGTLTVEGALTDTVSPRKVKSRLPSSSVNISSKS